MKQPPENGTPHIPVEHLLHLDPANSSVLLAALTYELFMRWMVMNVDPVHDGTHVRVRPSLTPAQRRTAAGWPVIWSHLLLGPDIDAGRHELAWFWGSSAQQIRSHPRPPLRRIGPGCEVSAAADQITAALRCRSSTAAASS